MYYPDGLLVGLANSLTSRNKVVARNELWVVVSKLDCRAPAVLTTASKAELTLQRAVGQIQFKLEASAYGHV
jgi:hypothetical protein